MERGVGVFAGHFPMRDDVRMLADQRKPLVGVRCQLEEQQREALRGARAHGNIGAADRDALGIGDGPRLEQPFQLDALPPAFAQQRDHVRHRMDPADQEFARDIHIGTVAQRARHDRLDHREDVLDPVIEFVDDRGQSALEADSDPGFHG